MRLHAQRHDGIGTDEATSGLYEGIDRHPIRMGFALETNVNGFSESDQTDHCGCHNQQGARREASATLLTLRHTPSRGLLIEDIYVRATFTQLA